MKTEDQAAALARRYAAALYSYLFLENGRESSLQTAHEVGRIGLSGPLSLLDMAEMYYGSLAPLLARQTTPEEIERTLHAGQAFFLESLSPFEMEHRQFREAVRTLQGLNDRVEDEISRIAHALHDEAGQLLASVHIALDEVASSLPDSMRAKVADIHHLLGRTESQLRRLSHELRPTMLDDLGLVAALEFLAEGAEARLRIPVHVEASLDQRLPPPVETALYRGVQEALSNVARHARASRVSIQVASADGTVRCIVEDDGIGFAWKTARKKRDHQGSMGLIGIRERIAAVGGSLRIDSAPGRATRLLLTAPTSGAHADTSAAGG